VSLSDVDRSLLQRCLDQEPNAWRDFADRFLGLVMHVVQRTASDRGRVIDEATGDDLVSEVFLVFLQRDAAVLRQFRRQCSLATYLTVVARRVVVRRLIALDKQLPRRSANPPAAQRHAGRPEPPRVESAAPFQHGRTDDVTLKDQVAAGGVSATAPVEAIADRQNPIEKIDDREQVEQLLLRLDDREARAVRLYHLEGKSYGEISRLLGLSENSVGPMLHRARAKMNGDSAKS